MVMGSSSTVSASVDFHVTDVQYPVLSLGKILEQGARLVMDGKEGYLIKGGKMADVKIIDHVLMVEVSRPSRPTQTAKTPVIVSSLGGRGRGRGLHSREKGAGDGGVCRRSEGNSVDDL